MGSRWDTTCGHDSPNFGWGLCSKCYRRYQTLLHNPDALERGSYGKRIGVPACHSDRPIAAKMLCQSCYDRKRRYGANFTSMYKAQNGLCKACGSFCTESEMVVDHNHETNEVRGLLCTPCNLALVHSDVSKLKALVAYLKDND